MKTRTALISVFSALLLGVFLGYGFRPETRPVANTDSESEGTFSYQDWKAESKRIAYVLPNDGPYYDLKWSGIRTELRAQGYEPQKYSAGGYANLDAQTHIMDDLVQKGIGGIILHAINQDALVKYVDRAAEAGIPVVAENVAVNTSMLAGSVQLANYENGYELAMALVEAIGGEGKLAALVGPAGLEASDEMWKGAQAYFSRWPAVEIIREEYLPAKVPEALQIAESILAANRDIKGFYTWYVQNGIGAAQAIKAAGFSPGEIKLVAKDINPQGEELLREGYITALLVGEPVTMGRRSARLIAGLLEGRNPDRDIQLRNVLVTLETLDKVNRSGFEPAR